MTLLSWDIKKPKKEKTLEEALKEGDYNVISEGDEGFKEISEKLGIKAKPGDNLKLEDNVIEGPWEGSSKSTAPGTSKTKIDLSKYDDDALNALVARRHKITCRSQ